MKRFFRLFSLLLALALILPLVPTAQGGDISRSQGTTGDYQSVILFTQDIHEHFLPVSDGEGGTYGGLARLATLLDQERQRYPDALTVDAGDFSMGSLFQTLYATQAPELQLLGQLGYDAVTLGNHEYDYRAQGLASMLQAAVASGSPLPALVQCNYRPRTQDQEGYSETDQLVWEAMEAYGVQDYVTFSRGGVTYGIFGLFGTQADSYAPLSGMVLTDPVQAAQATVDRIRAEVGEEEPLFVICLSHCGTDSGEDQELARKVEGIDLLVSGHSHVVLEEPLLIEDTLIVSGGCYTQYLGELVVHWNQDGTRTGYDYRLLPLGDDVAQAPAILREIDRAQALVEDQYLSQFGCTGYHQVLTQNSIAFDSVDDLYENHRESGLGNLIADAYRFAVAQAEGPEGDPVDVALTACGVIRDRLPTGPVTVSDAFNVSSLGLGADGLAGYPLVSVYLTGADLEQALEVDASITGLMPEAQLYLSGVSFTWNPYRMLFNRVEQSAQVLEDGTQVPLEQDRLYRVVTGLYCGQMLGAVEEKSFGLLSITPRDAQGNPIDLDHLEDYIVHDASGAEVKEWAALASYLQHLGGEIPQTYGQAQGRKVLHASLNPVSLLSNCNRLTFGVLCLAAALLLLAGVGIHRLHRHLRRSRRPDLRITGGGRRYTGKARPAHRPRTRSSGPGQPRRWRVSRRRYGSRPSGFQLSSYTGSSKRKSPRSPLPFSGLGRYRGKRR